MPLSLFKKIKKRHLLVAALLAFGFAVWNIDFAIGVLDTAILVMVTLGAILVSLFSATLSLILKRTEKAVFSLLICFAVVIGTVVGNTIIHQQLKDAQTHVESISKTIQMPFTPLHFGPHACVSLALHRYCDVPLFIGVNIAIDIEPLLVMVFNLNSPLHGLGHTLLFGGIIGLLLAAAAYPLRHRIQKAMRNLRLPHSPTFARMALSGVTGAWLHIFFDAPLYHDIKPLYPLEANPLLGLVPSGAITGLSAACFVPAMLLYAYRARRAD